MAYLKGKVSVVSGSSRGIGKAIARTLLSKGATVYITGRNYENLNSAYEELKIEFGDNVKKYCTDLTVTENISGLMNHVLHNEKKLDIVVANIGSGRSKQGWDVEDSYWTESFDINFFSSVRLVRETVRKMKEINSKGSIVLIASIAGCERIAAPLPYSAAKAALLSYMKGMSALIGEYGIRINAVSPGNILFEGGTWDNRLAQNKEETENYIKKNVPMARFGTPEEIGNIVTCLCTDNASFITGANIIIDGGQTYTI